MNDDDTASFGDGSFGEGLAEIVPPAATRTRVNLSTVAANYKPKLEGYEIEERIGEGGMGTVWSAVQLSTRRKVALKLMNIAMDSESARGRFDREVELTARLEHPNIARVYDSGLHHGVYFYVMELIQGEPLDAYVKAHQLGQKQILMLMKSVALAVQHAHQRGVIHRDLKPSNILVSPDGEPHLLDFGLAKTLPHGEVALKISRDGELAGTPAFMSPEQAAGKSDILDTRSDVYSLGVMLYKQLTTCYPHDLSGAHYEVMRRMSTEDITRPRDVQPDMDRELEALLLKALARQPEDRYSSAGDFARDIDNFLHGEPLMARQPTITYFLRKRIRKHAAPLMVASAVILLVIVLSLVHFPVVLGVAGVAIVLAVVVFAFVLIRQERDSAVVERNRTQSLLRIAEAMNKQQELPDLWRLILTEARGLSRADAGSLFTREGESLEFVVAQNQTLTDRFGAQHVEELFTRFTIPISEQSIAGYVAKMGKPVNLADVRDISPRLPFKHNAEFDKRHEYVTRSMLAIPLKDPEDQVVGVLQLINCIDNHGNPVPFDMEEEALVASMASQAAVALRGITSFGPEHGVNDRRADVFIAVLLVALVGLIFGPTVNHDFVRYDDQTYVTDNALVQKGLTLEGLKFAFTEAGAANYTPLTWLSHMLDCQLFGLRAGMHHLVNVILHAANSVLLFLLLKNLTARRWPSAFVAILFAVHPMHVESVAWVAERKDLLSTLLMFLTIAAYARYVRMPRAKSYLLVLSLYVVALLAKPMVVTLPVLLLLLDYWPLRREVSFKKRIIEKIPLLVLALADGIATIIAQKHGGAVRTLEQFPLSFRWTNAIVSYARYIGKMFWPTNLAVFYPPPKAWPAVVVVLCGLILLALIAVAIWKARSQPYVFVGIAWFIITLLPVIGLIQVGRQAMADRYSYIPYIGLFVVVAFGLADVVAAHPRKRDAILAAAAIVAGAAGLFAYDQVQNWKDTFTLFSHALRVTENNSVAHVQIGNDYLRHNNFEVAERHYREAIRIDPKYAVGQMNIGHLLARRGQFAEAIPHYEIAIASKPELAEAHLGLGLALIEVNEPQRGASELREALRLKPALSAARRALDEIEHPRTSSTSRPKINSATE